MLKVAPFGYERYERTLIVNEVEAITVRRIYADYTSGKSIRRIVNELNEENVPRKNPDTPWRIAIVTYILTNEKYIGDQMYLKTARIRSRLPVSAITANTNITISKNPIRLSYPRRYLHTHRSSVPREFRNA